MTAELRSLVLPQKLSMATPALEGGEGKWRQAYWGLLANEHRKTEKNNQAKTKLESSGFSMNPCLSGYKAESDRKHVKLSSGLGGQSTHICTHIQKEKGKTILYTWGGDS